MRLIQPKVEVLDRFERQQVIRRLATIARTCYKSENLSTAYLNLTKLGWSAEKARMVLPMSIKTEINMKCNLREWRHVLDLRCSNAAHPDIRKLVLDLLKQFHEMIPIVFDDLYDKYYESEVQNS